MSGAHLQLAKFLATRVSCPVCGAGRSVTNLPVEWTAHRAAFDCEAVFVARGLQILSERACSDRSKTAAKLWTDEAIGPLRPAAPAPQGEASMPAAAAAQDEGDGA